MVTIYLWNILIADFKENSFILNQYIYKDIDEIESQGILNEGSNPA